MNDLKTLRGKYTLGSLSKGDLIKEGGDLQRALFNLQTGLADSPIRSITVTPTEIVYRSNQQDLEIAITHFDPRIAPIEGLNFGTYETEVNSVLNQLASHIVQQKLGCFLDVGANIGWYSMHIAKQFGNLRVHSFEPNPRCANSLSQNVVRNKLTNITVHPFALGATEGVVVMEGTEETSGAGFCRASSEPSSSSIQMKTLDSFTEKQSGAFGPIGLIKIDIEGGELFFFEGAQKTIVDHQPIVVFEMLRKWSARFNYHPNDIIAKLNKIDYSIYSIGETGIKPISAVTDETLETNYIGVRSDQQSVMQSLSIG